jgi:hypothetical protein
MDQNPAKWTPSKNIATEQKKFIKQTSKLTQALQMFSKLIFKISMQVSFSQSINFFTSIENKVFVYMCL